MESWDGYFAGKKSSNSVHVNNGASPGRREQLEWQRNWISPGRIEQASEQAAAKRGSHCGTYVLRPYIKLYHSTMCTDVDAIFANT